MTTIAALVRGRADDHRIGLVFEGRHWTWAEAVQAMADRARWLANQRGAGPFNIGVLLENTPEFHFWLGAAALCGAAVAGINPTRRGAELARDITHTDSCLIITDTRQR
jgi:fatty-acyl-CoA synthase